MNAEKKARLGQRWVCFSCSSRFYDLNKPEPVCPKCGADQRQSPALEAKKKPRRGARKKEGPATRPIPKRLLEEDDDRGKRSFGADDDDDDDDLNLDADDDDVAELDLAADSDIVELEVEED